MGVDGGSNVLVTLGYATAGTHGCFVRLSEIGEEVEPRMLPTLPLAAYLGPGLADREVGVSEPREVDTVEPSDG